MLIKDQLRVRMEQLGVSVPELARRVGVSNQTVRFWLDGRNFPGKRHAPAVEKALSFRLDFSEGGDSMQSPTVSSMMERTDIELFLLINKLPPDLKLHFHRMIEVLVETLKPPPGPELRDEEAERPRRKRI